MATRTVERVQWFFDPMCPYAYQSGALDPGRAQPGAGRHHVAVLLARGHQPRAREEAPVGAAVVVRLGPDAGRRAHPARAGQRRRRPLVRGGRPRVLRRRRDAPTIRTCTPRSSSRPASIRRSSSGRSPTRRPPTRCAPTTTKSSTQYGGHGVPTIVFESGYAVYGPVVVPAPDGRGRARALGPRARHAAVPAPVRAPAPEDERRSSATSPSSSARTCSTRDWKTIEKPGALVTRLRTRPARAGRDRDDALHLAGDTGDLRATTVTGRGPHRLRRGSRSRRRR